MNTSDCNGRDDGARTFVEYDIETLWWRAQNGVRPDHMSPEQSAAYDGFITDLECRPDAQAPDRHRD